MPLRQLSCVLRSRAMMIAFCLCMPLAVSGCGTNVLQYYFGNLFGGSETAIEKNAEQLAAEGMEQMREKDYDAALKSFQKLKEQYPYSKYAILAELKLGDAHFHNQNYPEAALAYEEFARLHPRNEVIPYVLYQLGMSHFLTFTTVDRDQGETQQAIEAFQRVIQSYPDSQYGKKAQEQLYECQKRLVAHEYYVGEFYFKQGRYRSAKERLDKISQGYPDAVRDLGYDQSVRKMLEEANTELSKGEPKPSIWSRMGF